MHRKLRGTPSGRLPPCTAVILVPGLWLWRDPWLQWAAGCAGAIRAAGSQPVWFGYSRRVAWTAFLRPTGGTAAELVRRFLALYDRVRARHGPPSVIAHSFGTYLVTRALSDFEGARLRALILFGSIVSETFDWVTIVVFPSGGRPPARHLMAYRLRDAGVPEEHADAILGHAGGGGVVRDYRKGVTPLFRGRRLRTRVTPQELPHS